MDDKNKKAIGIGLGALAVLGLGIGLSKMRGNGGGTGQTCGVGSHWDENHLCVPDDEVPIPPEIEMTPEAIWERANMVCVPMGTLNTNIMEGVATPRIELRLKNISPLSQPKVFEFVIDKWMKKLADQGVATVECGLITDPAARNDGRCSIIGTEVGQLFASTWGAQIRIFEWDGNKWSMVFDGFLGPHQGWSSNAAYYLMGEADLDIKFDNTFPQQPDLWFYVVLNGGATCEVGIGAGQVAYWSTGPMSSWTSRVGSEIVPTADQWYTIHVPLVVARTGGGVPSPMTAPYTTPGAQVQWFGRNAKYNPDWYTPPSTLENYVSAEELAIYDEVFSYSMTRPELYSDVIKLWGMGLGYFGTVGFGTPPGLGLGPMMNCIVPYISVPVTII